MNYQEACGWLGLDPYLEIDESVLKSAFRRAAIREHPDKSSHEQATQRFQRVQEANELVLQQVQLGATGSSADLEATMEDDGVYECHEDEDRDREAEIVNRYYEEYDALLEVYGVCESESEVAFSEELCKKLDEMYDKALRKIEKLRARLAKSEAHKQEMEAKFQQAMQEGREFFEAWEFRRLKEEAKSRGLNVFGLQRETVVELLIEDETKNRLRRELKEEAPLVFEWVEVFGLPHSWNGLSALNGCKAWAVDFYDGTCWFSIHLFRFPFEINFIQSQYFFAWTRPFFRRVHG